MPQREFWLRLGMGFIGLIIGGWGYAGMGSNTYLGPPSLVLILGSLLAMLSAFVPWLRPRKRRK